MSVLTDAHKRVQEFASENASTLLTAGGVVGTVATAVLAGRAGLKSAQILEEARNRKFIQNHEPLDDLEDDGSEQLTKMETFAAVGPQFIPPVVTGGLTITAIIFANRISAKEAAALAAAYGLSKQQLEEYKAKVAEKITGPKNQQIKDEIAQDKINENPPSKQVVIIAGGDVLCYDSMSGRYFRSSMEQIKRAEAEINHELFDSQNASVSEFYDKIGLPATSLSDQLGWTAFDEGSIEFEVTTGTTDNNEPCLVITPSRTPEPNFHKLP